MNGRRTIVLLVLVVIVLLSACLTRMGVASEPTARPRPDPAGFGVTLGENEYFGVGRGGYNGRVYVTVTVGEDGSIAAVTVVGHSESEGIGTVAIELLPGMMVEAQSADVDIVTGATNTSEALIEAVKDALSQLEE